MHLFERCMHVCMYVCMYVCIVCMHVRIYACMYVCMHACACRLCMCVSDVSMQAAYVWGWCVYVCRWCMHVYLCLFACVANAHWTCWCLYRLTGTAQFGASCGCPRHPRHGPSLQASSIVPSIRGVSKKRCCYEAYTASWFMMLADVRLAAHMSNGIFMRTKQEQNAPLLSERLKNEMHACNETGAASIPSNSLNFEKSKEWSASRMRCERDRNEIPMRPFYKTG